MKFDHFKNIEELIQHLEMWYAEYDYYAYDRFFGLRDARIMGMIIYQLTNNWRLLEEWVKNDKEKAMVNFECGRCFNMYDILDKMKEIKGDKQ